MIPTSFDIHVLHDFTKAYRVL